VLVWRRAVVTVAMVGVLVGSRRQAVKQCEYLSICEDEDNVESRADNIILPAEREVSTKGNHRC
jgi:hypothetical protein